MVESELKSAVLHFNGKTYNYTGEEILVEGLKPNTEYEYYFEYTFERDGKTLSSATNVQTFKTGSDDPVHEHKFVDGKCECGEVDPNWEAPHEHEFVDGKCECGEVDPDYEDPDHEHEFVDGECECGEKEPTENKPQTPNNGGMNCSMGFVSLLPLLGAAALLLIKKRK